MTIGVGIAGFGLSGAVFHAPLIGGLADFTIKAIMTSQQDKVKRDWPEARIVSDFEELIASPDIDLVVLGLPNYLHFELASKALMAGKHVVVEKPFVPTVEEAEQLCALAKEKGKVLTVFHNRRLDGDFLTLKQLIAEDRLGAISYYEAHFDRFKGDVDARWKEQAHAGGGNLFDLGSHLLDQALVLFGLPDQVIADVQAQRPGAINDDYFHVILKYGSMRVVLHASMLVAKQPFRYLVHGSKASWLKTGIDPQENRLKAGPHQLDFEAIGDEDQAYYGELTPVDGSPSSKIPTKAGCYLDFYRGVAAAINGTGSAVVPAEEAADVIRIIAACQQSMRENRTINFSR